MRLGTSLNPGLARMHTSAYKRAAIITYFREVKRQKKCGEVVRMEIITDVLRRDLNCTFLLFEQVL